MTPHYPSEHYSRVFAAKLNRKEMSCPRLILISEVGSSFSNPGLNFILMLRVELLIQKLIRLDNLSGNRGRGDDVRRSKIEFARTAAAREVSVLCTYCNCLRGF